MSGTSNPMAKDLDPAPAVSTQTIHMTGLLVDVHGLAELSPSATSVAVLWLHNPRTSRKEHMADIAARAVAAYNATPAASSRGLVAAAFDQRNHGTRAVREAANGAWRNGNGTHAQDMFGVIAGTVADTSLLIDLFGAYVFPDRLEGFVDRHLVLGVSLGGHSAWQVMFRDPRVEAGVMVIGCPDFINLLTDRARLTKLSTFDVSDHGATFLGSKDFPHGLVQSCFKYDPRGILFNKSEPAWPSSPETLEQVRTALASRVAGKKFLVTSGGADKLVNYECSRPFLDVFKKAAQTWPELGMSVEDNVYPGIGHEFSAGMVKDAVRFIVDAVTAPESGSKGPNGGEDRSSKI